MTDCCSQCFSSTPSQRCPCECCESGIQTYNCKNLDYICGCRCDTIQILTPGELYLLSALVIMMKLSKSMMTHHPNGERRWSLLKAVYQEQSGPVTSMGTNPRGRKAMLPGRYSCSLLDIKG